MDSGGKKQTCPVSEQALLPWGKVDFISQLILETEALLSNRILSKAYSEEDGPYAGMSRIVIKRFRLYFEQFENEILIVAVLFPGEK